MCGTIASFITVVLYNEGKYCTRLTIGGDVLEYAENSSSSVASLPETKIIINSIILDAHKGARFIEQI